MEWLGAFHFLRPWWLLVALPPLLVALRSLLSQQEGQQWKDVIAPHLLAHLVTRGRRKRWLAPEVLLLPFALMLAVAMAGPTYQLAETPEGPDDTTLIVLVDLSSSMKAHDIGPSRIARLRLKLRDLINLRRGARIGIVAVAGSAHVVMPPTEDADALVPYIEVLEPDLMPEDGERFDSGAKVAQELAAKEKGPVVMLVAADAIPPEGVTALKGVGSQGIRLITWAVGTKSGGKDANLPGLDMTGFEALERSGADLVELSLSDGDVRDIERLLDRARTASADPKDAKLWEDSGYGLVFVFAIGVALWFRRGWVLGRAGTILLALMLTGCSSGSAEDLWWEMWLTPDQQGRRLFERGDYQQAAEKFADPMWKGTAYYAASQWKKAQLQFARVDSPEGLFNLANAHAQAKEIASALHVYDKALRKRPTFRAARKNRDYFQQVMDGLEESADMEEASKPDGPADRTKAGFKEEQLTPPNEESVKKKQAQEAEKDSTDSTDTEQWMKRVSTNPADFLRAKFAVQARDQEAKP